MNALSITRPFILVPLALAIGLAIAFVRYAMSLPVAPTPAQRLAAAQSDYDRFERTSRRGTRFYELTFELHHQGSGSMSEQEIVQRLGPPDGFAMYDGSRMLIYYYQYGDEEWFAMAELRDGRLRSRIHLCIVLLSETVACVVGSIGAAVIEHAPVLVDPDLRAVASSPAACRAASRPRGGVCARASWTWSRIRQCEARSVEPARPGNPKRS